MNVSIRADSRATAIVCRNVCQVLHIPSRACLWILRIEVWTNENIFKNSGAVAKKGDKKGDKKDEKKEEKKPEP